MGLGFCCLWGWSHDWNWGRSHSEVSIFLRTKDSLVLDGFLLLRKRINLWGLILLFLGYLRILWGFVCEIALRGFERVFELSLKVFVNFRGLGSSLFGGRGMVCHCFAHFYPRSTSFEEIAYWRFLGSWFICLLLAFRCFFVGKIGIHDCSITLRLATFLIFSIIWFLGSQLFTMELPVEVIEVVVMVMLKVLYNQENFFSDYIVSSSYR